MKKYALPLALVSVITLQACNQQSSTSQEAAVEAPAGVSLETSEQRLSYGIAFGLGQRMAADGVPMDADAFSAGLTDALEGAEPRLSQEEISAEMQAYQEKRRLSSKQPRLSWVKLTWRHQRFSWLRMPPKKVLSLPNPGCSMRFWKPVKAPSQARRTPWRCTIAALW
jgi:hypothetical protein